MRRAERRDGGVTESGSVSGFDRAKLGALMLGETAEVTGEVTLHVSGLVGPDRRSVSN